ncbi:uncharacterized protein [Dysidea avara]|uniref:uncharacterized protein isoform X2 n=1 Tax=Dysidea avara TaxID=196820 RepID=UPI0033209F29
MAKAHDKLTKEAEAATQSMCDYLRLRKVWFDDKKIKKSKADKKLKKWRKRWLVFKSESIPENSTLKYYKTEEQWMTSPEDKNVICEPLNDMIILRRIHLSGKPHILAVVFSSHSLWLSFKSHTSLTMWMEKLSHIIQSKCYLVQLVKSTNEAIKPATYLLQVHSDKITGYRTAHNNLKETAWSWDISTFYAYRVHKLSVTEIEIIIGKESVLSGHFHFIGPDLENLCKCIMESTVNQDDDEPHQYDAKKLVPSPRPSDYEVPRSTTYTYLEHERKEEGHDEYDYIDM